MERLWRIQQETPIKLGLPNQGLPDLALKILYNRGLQTPSAVEDFLNPRYEKLHDAFLFNDMAKAVDRVLKAIGKKEKIMIYGDYDADGVTSSAILFKTLQIVGANVAVFIPHREDDGYGLNVKRIQEFIDNKVKLLITVDCGITNIKEIDFANENNIEVIVTDHHEALDDLPKAYAIIDPKVKDDKYPCRFLSGAGVAYKLAGAVLKTIELKSEVLSKWGGVDGFLKWLLDLVAIGTVADVVPLLDENRLLVKFGLKVLGQTRRPGLIKLAEVAGLDLKRADSYMIGYQISPRLNAAGRLNHAELSFRLLTTDDEVEAEKLAFELNKTNTDRQKLTEQAMVSAREQLAEQMEKQMLFVYNENIQAGIIGLVAGRLCEEFYRPIMVMTKVKEKIVGSGRSIEYFNIVETLFANGHLLSRFGGHAQACGFAMTEVGNLIEFQNNVLLLAENCLADMDLKPSLEVDADAGLPDLNLSLVKTLNAFEPFGEGNEKPKFLLKNLQVTALDYLGDSGKHLKLMVKGETSPLVSKLLAFFFKDKFPSDINVGDRIDAVVEAGLNVWNGYENVECKVVDMRKVEKVN
jgi:single-stranded-DNA-specific exonuclease